MFILWLRTATGAGKQLLQIKSTLSKKVSCKSTARVMVSVNRLVTLYTARMWRVAKTERAELNSVYT